MVARTEVIDLLASEYPGVSVTEFRHQSRVIVNKESCFEVLQKLKEQFRFDLLVDITCVDYLQYRGAEHRFGLVYLLANCETAERITIRVLLDEPAPSVPSVTPLWEGADWMEREVWDMFGVQFEGHPNLIRILMPQEFSAHPLRKDYPLQGRGERHNFPVITRSQA
jgi:NADH-quinone oxidoreductase subunit C